MEDSLCTNLWSENNLLTFQLDALVIFRAKVKLGVKACTYLQLHTQGSLGFGVRLGINNILDIPSPKTYMYYPAVTLPFWVFICSDLLLEVRKTNGNCYPLATIHQLLAGLLSIRGTQLLAVPTFSTNKTLYFDTLIDWWHWCMN